MLLWMTLFLFVLGIIWVVRRKSINDVATDIEKPLKFIVKDKPFSKRSIAWQKELHPNLAPLYVKGFTQNQVFEKLMETLKELKDIEIIKIHDQERKIQFVATTRFGLEFSKPIY